MTAARSFFMGSDGSARALLQFRSDGRGKTINPEGLVVTYQDDDLTTSRIQWMTTGRVFTGYQFGPE